MSGKQKIHSLDKWFIIAALVTFFLWITQRHWSWMEYISVHKRKKITGVKDGEKPEIQIVRRKVKRPPGKKAKSPDFPTVSSNEADSSANLPEVSDELTAALQRVRKNNLHR